MASRPKRQCKDRAIEAMNNIVQRRFEDSDEDEDDSSMQIFDNVASDEQVPEEQFDELTADDESLHENDLVTMDSDSETESGDERADVPIHSDSYVSPSGRVWKTNTGVTAGREPARNIVRFTQGPAAGVNPSNEREAILMFLSKTLTTTLLYSNLQGRRITVNWNRANPDNQKKFVPIDLPELEAFVGLLILLGAFRSKYRDVTELWGARDGFPICRATMTRERFLQIKSVLRFDDPLRRDHSDRLAPLRDVFQEFNADLSRFFIPSPYLTVDEQLLEFHGRVRFQQYISSKPGKFGIKFLWLCCAETFYILNGIVYIGVGTVRPNENVTTLGVTMHLMAPYLGTGRHLTADNWYTSMELVDALREKNTTYIGTVRNNNRGVPAVAKSTEGRQRKDTKVFYDEQGTALVSFWDKGRKPVLLVDNFHRHVPEPEVNTKASTVLEYNRTKSGVDIADKRLRGFSCKRKCRRWPVSIFSNMVDIAGNNGCIVYYHKHPEEARKCQQHYKFLVNAGYQLVDKQIKRRLQTPANLRESTKSAMKLVGYAVTQTEHFGGLRLEKSVRCAFCPSRNDRKTFVCCAKCEKPRCNSHRSDLCKECV